ncbi:MAG: hypothetical protein M0P57_03135 [Syntrophales bacterium]|nr:hypothetical protein [Syntrophales bacterium]MDY0045338.1 hypothetical protein [Syntrophales bacterium]
MKKAEEEGPQAVTSINQIFKKMDEGGYQWDADPIMSWQPVKKEIERIKNSS